MLIDSLTYAVNQYAESKRGTKNGKNIEFAAVVLSTLALFGITAFTMFAATKRLQTRGPGGTNLSEANEKETAVDMRYVLAFGCAGILFDAISLTCFYLNSRVHQTAADTDHLRPCSKLECKFTDDVRININPTISGSKTFNKAASSELLVNSQDRHCTIRGCRHIKEVDNSEENSGRLNMRSALVHSAGDLLRSSATIIASAVSLLGHTDPEVTDAACAIGFSIVIALGGVSVLRDLYANMGASRKTRRSSGDLCGDQLAVASFVAAV